MHFICWRFFCFLKFHIFTKKYPLPLEKMKLFSLLGTKDQPMSVLPADPMADVFFGTSADGRSDPMFSVDINNALKNANTCWHTTECSHFHRRVYYLRPAAARDLGHGRNLLHECTRVPVPLSIPRTRTQVPMRGDFRRVEMLGFSRQEISWPILPSFPFQSTQIFPSNVLFKL